MFSTAMLTKTPPNFSSSHSNPNLDTNYDLIQNEPKYSNEKW